MGGHWGIRVDAETRKEAFHRKETRRVLGEEECTSVEQVDRSAAGRMGYGREAKDG